MGMDGAVASGSMLVAPANLAWEDALDIIFLGGLIIVAMVAMWVVIVLVRRRINQRSTADHSSPFTLEGVRQLHRQGLISDEEFERMRQRIIAELTSGIERDTDDRNDGEQPKDESAETAPPEECSDDAAPSEGAAKDESEKDSSSEDDESK